MALFKLFTGRGRGRKNYGGNNPSAAELEAYKKNHLECRVIMLDDSDVTIYLPKKELGQELINRANYNLDIIEKDYFGLQYTDSGNVPHWLDPTKTVKKQVKIGPPYTFRYRVKFYSSEPNNLREELTRYQLFLQLKQDILSGRLQADYETAVELPIRANTCLPDIWELHCSMDFRNTHNSFQLTPSRTSVLDHAP